MPLSKRFTKALDDRAARPLNADALAALATTYVARYQTSSGKLTAYLKRKLRERGWEDADNPQIAAIVARCVERGYIDDQSFAMARAGALARKGYGPRRVAAALRAAGIDPGLIDTKDNGDDDEVRRIAHIYARKRRIGPYARNDASPDQIRKWIAAMINAGHSYTIASELARLPPADN